MENGKEGVMFSTLLEIAEEKDVEWITKDFGESFLLSYLLLFALSSHLYASKPRVGELRVGELYI